MEEQDKVRQSLLHETTDLKMKEIITKYIVEPKLLKNQAGEQQMLQMQKAIL